tara:strand:- start:4721 stop:4939 length:219 start_codon:yes stop_codon:yes gene_type:complete
MKQDYLVTLRLKEDTETFQAFWYADNLISAAVSAKREVEKSYSMTQREIMDGCVVVVKVEETNSVPLRSPNF